MEHLEQNILVSVICTAYNHESYIRQCLDGFVMQKTNFSFEVLVHDDASTDRTADIIREYEAKYPDIIKPIYQNENQYSKGIAIYSKFIYPNVNGKYIAICEGDDYWIDPFKLQKQVDFLETNEEYGLVFTDIDIYYQITNTFKKEYLSSSIIPIAKSFVEHLYNGGFIAPCTWLVRRDFFMQEYGTKKYIDGTFVRALDIWAKTKIYFHREVTAVYRMLEESVSHSNSLQKRFNFSLGLFQIKKDYIVKYRDLVSDEDEYRILKKGYIMLSKSALALNSVTFLKEAESFFFSHGLFQYWLLLKIRYIAPIKLISIYLYRRKGFII